jgi:hypothetical protein
VPKSASFAFEIATISLREQIQRVDALDTKAGILLAADGIAATLVFNRNALPTATPTAIILVSGLAVLTSLASTLISFVNRNYALAPTPEVVTGLADTPEDWIRWRMIGNLLEALDVNRAKLRQKARFLTGGQFALLVGLVVMGGYSLYATLFGGA